MSKNEVSSINKLELQKMFYEFIEQHDENTNYSVLSGTGMFRAGRIFNKDI